MTVRITCINKDGGYHENPNVAISHLGWTEDGTNKTGKSTRLEIYDWIKNQNGKAYVRDANGNTAGLARRKPLEEPSMCGPTATTLGPTIFLR